MAESPQPCNEILARLVNVLSVIHSHVYFPTYSNGLKSIGAYLGFRWTEPEASGILSIVWRRRWEEARQNNFKDRLITYNREDCEALRQVTDALRDICVKKPTQDGAAHQQDHEVRHVEDIAQQSSRREWCQMDYAVPEFKFVNERAYFDYQRERVFIRSSTALKTSLRQERRNHGKKNLRANRTVELIVTNCPSCDGTDVTTRQDRRLKRVAYDLQVKDKELSKYKLLTASKVSEPGRIFDSVINPAMRYSNHIFNAFEFVHNGGACCPFHRRSGR